MCEPLNPGFNIGIELRYKKRGFGIQFGSQAQGRKLTVFPGQEMINKNRHGEIPANFHLGYPGFHFFLING